MSCSSHLAGGVLFQGLLDGDEVLEALGHLEPLDVQVARVQEVVNPLPAVVLGLCLLRRQDEMNGGGRATGSTISIYGDAFGRVYSCRATSMATAIQQPFTDPYTSVVHRKYMS